VRLLGKREWGGSQEFEKWFGGRGDTQGVEGSTPGAQLPGGETGHGSPPLGGAAPVAFRRL